MVNCSHFKQPARPSIQFLPIDYKTKVRDGETYTSELMFWPEFSPEGNDEILELLLRFLHSSDSLMSLRSYNKGRSFRTFNVTLAEKS